MSSKSPSKKYNPIEGLQIDKTRLSNVLRMFKEEAIAYFILTLIFAGLLAYSYAKLYECESKPSLSCPYFTCATKDSSCGNHPFYYDAKGNKVCITG